MDRKVLFVSAVMFFLVAALPVQAQYVCNYQGRVSIDGSPVPGSTVKAFNSTGELVREAISGHEDDIYYLNFYDWELPVTFKIGAQQLDAQQGQISACENLEIYKLDLSYETPQQPSGGTTDTGGGGGGGPTNRRDVIVIRDTGNLTKVTREPGPSGCLNEWLCEEWSVCNEEGKQIRNCTYTGNCDGVDDELKEIRDCIFHVSGEEADKDAGVIELQEDQPTCTDGIQNQGEEDVDCGGPCPPCRNGAAGLDALWWLLIIIIIIIIIIIGAARRRKKR